MQTRICIPEVGAVAGASAIALDFETASANPGSICAIGLAWIRGQEVTHVAHRLVKPHDMYFNPWNVAIHGLGPRDVEDEPEFPAIWDELLPHLEAVPLLLAHNAPFDIGVLRRALAHYRLPVPSLSFLCTVKIARAAWPDLTDHKLSTVAAHIGIALRHHEADSDAAACAGIAIRATQEAGVLSLADALPRWSIQAGRLERDHYEPCATLSDRAAQRRRQRIPAWLRRI
ncbi:MAG TPA: 3'-5' exonuclease [Ferrovibrio sp.]|uniref:3'-5' exonuclease n=1 Tax=Ferrovibrio sp. TaxID=1917215 RepID=UPI002ED624FD